MGCILPAEMGLMKTVRLTAQEGSVLNAAVWLREHLAVPDYDSVDTEFEQYFGCRVVREPPDDRVYGKIYVEFDEQSAALFVLRWS